VIRRGKSPLIFGDLDPFPPSASDSARRTQPTLIGQEPLSLGPGSPRPRIRVGPHPADGVSASLPP
jgi:hypothetical protein